MRQTSRGICRLCQTEMSKAWMTRHLSAFEIDGVQYSYLGEESSLGDWSWGPRQKPMKIELEKVLLPGQTCTYEYDFGTTTELKLKIIEKREVTRTSQKIRILARNIPPITP